MIKLKLEVVWRRDVKKKKQAIIKLLSSQGDARSHTKKEEWQEIDSRGRMKGRKKRTEFARRTRTSLF